MTLAERLKQLRREFDLSQEAIGAQGFVSAPGWIKIENGQRAASEKLLQRLRDWLVRDRYMKAGPADSLHEELLLLKYLGHTSPYVRNLAAIGAAKIGRSDLLVPTDAPKSRRGRPVGTNYAARRAVAA